MNTGILGRYRWAEFWNETPKLTLPDVSRAVVPVIGPRWEGLGAEGVPRIAEPNDWIAKELLMAHAAGCAVLPVLVQRATLDFEKLPERLNWLKPIQNTQATYDDLEHDLQRVLATLDAIVLPKQDS